MNTIVEFKCFVKSFLQESFGIDIIFTQGCSFPSKVGTLKINCRLNYTQLFKKIVCLLTEGSHWKSSGLPGVLSQPAINKETPKGRTPLKISYICKIHCTSKQLFQVENNVKIAYQTNQSECTKFAVFAILQNLLKEKKNYKFFQLKYISGKHHSYPDCVYSCIMAAVWVTSWVVGISSPYIISYSIAIFRARLIKIRKSGPIPLKKDANIQNCIYLYTQPIWLLIFSIFAWSSNKMDARFSVARTTPSFAKFRS